MYGGRAVSEQSTRHLGYRIHSRYRVEMDILYSMLIKFLALVDSPFHAQLSHLLVGLASDGLLRQFLRDVTVESLGHHCYL